MAPNEEDDAVVEAEIEAVRRASAPPEPAPADSNASAPQMSAPLTPEEPELDPALLSRADRLSQAEGCLQ